MLFHNSLVEVSGWSPGSQGSRENNSNAMKMKTSKVLDNPTRTFANEGIALPYGDLEDRARSNEPIWILAIQVQ